MSLDSGMRSLALPALDIWEKVLGRKVELVALEDNEATLQIVKTGKNPSLRRISRVHGVSISWLHDLFKQEGIGIKYQFTGGQKADIFTKVFKDRTVWNSVRSLVGIRPPLCASGGNALDLVVADAFIV